MNLLETFRSALRTLRNQRMRTALTLFGLVWGTASVIFLMSWGAGTRLMVESGYTKIGKNIVQVWAGRIGEDFTPAADRRKLWFTQEHVDILKRRSRLADRVVGEVSAIYLASFGQKSVATNVRGVDPDIYEMRSVSLAAGRAITDRDVSTRARVAVVGAKMRRDLLGPGGKLGSRIRIYGRSYEVVGFLDEVGTQFWSDSGFQIDEQIWVPISTLLSIQPDHGTGDEIIHALILRLKDRRNYDEFRTEIRTLLAPSLGVSPTDEEAIMIGSPIDGLRKLPMDGLGVVMFILGATTLGIGGIGILTMMLDAVQERRQEIGVRLAVGARRRDILLQFFLETIMIALVGGAVGVALGIACCELMQAASVPGRIPEPIMTWDIVVAAVVSMMMVGVISGTVPAWRASRVDPSITLRAE